jgi:thiol-disulfide isomerase/thioredoxin
MNPSRLLTAILLLAWLAPSAAQDVQPFVRGSFAGILEAHHGRPFILALWSLDCVHCRDDFVLFEKLSKSHPSLDIILVATDSPAQNAAITAMLRHYHLQNTEAWVFADSFVERLRFEVDKLWQGELPRTYLFNGGGKAEAVSGRLNDVQLMRWVQEHTMTK